MTDPMNLAFEAVDPSRARSETLRTDLLETWISVTNDGGAVGFTAPAPEDEIAAAVDTALERVASGDDALGTLRRDSSVVGLGLLVDRGSALCRHWRTVLRVMVRPDCQGLGAGRTLMNGLHDLGRQLGLDHLQLTVREGADVQGFYERLGYVVVGRHPRAVRVGPGEDRDEIMLVCDLAPTDTHRGKAVEELRLQDPGEASRGVG